MPLSLLVAIANLDSGKHGDLRQPHTVRSSIPPRRLAPKRSSNYCLQLAPILTSLTVLFRKLADDLITEAAKGAKGEHPRVAVCGEGVHTLLAAGNLEATIKLERMWDEIAQRNEVDVLCGYFRNTFASEESISTLE